MALARASIPLRLSGVRAGRFNSKLLVCLLVIGCVASFFAGRRIGLNQTAARPAQMPNGDIPCKSGPWGDLAYAPFTIAAPEEFISIRGVEKGGTHWFLKGYTTASLVALLQSTSLTPDQQRAFLDPAVLHIQPDGIDLTPSPDLVFSLPYDARGAIYQALAQDLDHQSQINFVPADTLQQRFTDSGVSPATVALFKHLCWQRGNYLIFSSQAAIFSRIPSYEEKVRFVQALTRQRTMLLHLNITPQSNIDALTQYWGKGCWDTDVRTIFKSMQAIPNGTWMNILIVLPPLPTAELYDFPTPAYNPLAGAPVDLDCHWTTFNFFRDVPDPNFTKAEYVLKELKDNYEPIPGDPRYGDVVIFSKPDGEIIHSAVFIADDICFTKNGSSIVQPWLLATIPDILEEYSILVPPGQSLTVSYFRNKRI